MWQGKTHRESHERAGAVEHEATFAVSPSGYIDVELGLEYIKQHFEPYTSRGGTVHADTEATTPPPRCLIIDSHSSHVA